MCRATAGARQTSILRVALPSCSSWLRSSHTGPRFSTQAHVEHPSPRSPLRCAQSGRCPPNRSWPEHQGVLACSWSWQVWSRHSRDPAANQTALLALPRSSWRL
ncbi:uncharacterized protein B0I36DRAFT_313506 [Microdochium trichocladiopsis]|uniref:Uncharacterized protein n=1 Tax=Microdochium trichocladiopsis TaxID=1682393 RepID=A0A9P9BRT6_9PEZI|nr:uncharacterized protein B0I36DRAFT_313506 [Microdochium trichocladiopsis]KAH7037195.1 hypothetical protein B0I36DRAFT_313506 [Microdochium trichocladiopsis]